MRLLECIDRQLVINTGSESANFFKFNAVFDNALYIMEIRRWLVLEEE